MESVGILGASAQCYRDHYLYCLVCYVCIYPQTLLKVGKQQLTYCYNFITKWFYKKQIVIFVPCIIWHLQISRPRSRLS